MPEEARKAGMVVLLRAWACALMSVDAVVMFAGMAVDLVAAVFLLFRHLCGSASSGREVRLEQSLTDKAWANQEIDDAHDARFSGLATQHGPWRNRSQRASQVRGGLNDSDAHDAHFSGSARAGMLILMSRCNSCLSRLQAALSCLYYSQTPECWLLLGQLEDE